MRVSDWPLLTLSATHPSYSVSPPSCSAYQQQQIVSQPRTDIGPRLRGFAWRAVYSDPYPRSEAAQPPVLLALDVDSQANRRPLFICCRPAAVILLIVPNRGSTDFIGQVAQLQGMDSWCG